MFTKLQLIKRGTFSLLVCWFFLIATIWTAVSFGKWKKKTILKWDVSSYYLYLPATFLYRDLMHLKFYPAIDSVYHPSDRKQGYAITPYHLTGNKIIKYPLGVALFEIPGFTGASLWCMFNSTHPPDGWSEPYQLAIAMNSILFVFLGLLFLRRFLRVYFKELTTILTLLVVAFGTNLFFYTAVEPGFSHPYLFFLYCVILWFTQKWYQRQTFLESMIIGFSIGLATITRPTDILIILFPILWFSLSRSSRPDWWNQLKRARWKVLTAFGCMILPVLLQMTYWKATTGFWLYYSYEGEGFNFHDWHLIDGLFSYRKGWFIYTPLAILGFVGFFFVWKDKTLRFYLLASASYFLLTLWLTFSWWMWWYGGSFGARVMVQSTALLAFPIAALVERTMRRTFLLRFVLILIITSGIALNLFQSWQYNKAILHWGYMNKAYYWRVFGKTSYTIEDLKLLDN